jgi:catechol 2,3-dioxygenase-like lactoylglutathione lyase family enzyme
MSDLEFRFAYFTPEFEATVAFYREGLELPLADSWERGPDDRGALFRAASGIIEVLARPRSGSSSQPWDVRPPQGAFMVIEAEDVDELHRRALARNLPIQQELTLKPWGHRTLCLREPNGLTLYFFTVVAGPR